MDISEKSLITVRANCDKAKYDSNFDEIFKKDEDTLTNSDENSQKE